MADKRANPFPRVGVARLAGLVISAGSGFLGALLVLAAISKAVFPQGTLSTLGYAMEAALGGADFSSALALLGVCVLVAIEWVIGASLFMPRTRARALAASTGLFVVFALFVGWLAVTEAPVGCGCGLGNGSTMASGWDAA